MVWYNVHVDHTEMTFRMYTVRVTLQTGTERLQYCLLHALRNRQFVSRNLIFKTKSNSPTSDGILHGESHVCGDYGMLMLAGSSESQKDIMLQNFVTIT